MVSESSNLIVNSEMVVLILTFDKPFEVSFSVTFGTVSVTVVGLTDVVTAVDCVVAIVSEYNNLLVDSGMVELILNFDVSCAVTFGTVSATIDGFTGVVTAVDCVVTTVSESNNLLVNFEMVVLILTFDGDFDVSWSATFRAVSATIVGVTDVVTAVDCVVAMVSESANLLDDSEMVVLILIFDTIFFLVTSSFDCYSYN